MMTMELLLGLQINSEMAMPITLNDFIYCGVILEDDATVESIGLKSGSMIHALQREEFAAPIAKKYISEDCILQLAIAFKSFNVTPAFRSALHRIIKRPEVVDNIILSSPGLHKDAVAIAILQDPDLMSHFTDVDTVKKIAALHPTLIDAAQNVIAAVHEEAHNATSSGSSSSSLSSLQPTTARSYSVDNMTLEEEMARDIAQFFATHPVNDNAPSSTSSSANQPAASNQSTGVITTQMFMDAMRQAALATNSNPQQTSASVSVGSLSPVLPPFSSPLTDLDRQLGQMHEIGLLDDTVNIQALQFTNGDVQAAIELVFSGFNDN
ncbi:ubiquitin-like protein 7 isoform X2 [Pseudomyrmex gracilis]|uniref:ubiquitin-like protein 7 isoform X2 n=1 Tax=Pseudomyrmex gracilis TaxID=219809 RepID=UPI0009958C34|nr:ubiquitin-like protein 7 isoform X2 [Pseudomyrmex gracilis]